MLNNNPAVQHADRQAVVVIHGMGEQTPMDTIKNFVHATQSGWRINQADRVETCFAAIMAIYRG